MNLLRPALAAALLGLASPQLLAWGQTGHRAVALVAERHLSPEAVRKAEALLDGQSLAQVSTWADEIRSEPKAYGYSFPWHYTTWNDEDEAFHAGHETKDSGFLLSQVERQFAILKDAKASKAEKAQALKFAVHLIGDLHQPMHVGGGGDQGGNFCKVTWHGKATNLHAVWDGDIIGQTELSYTELADFASAGRSASQTAAWQTGTPRDWAAESRTLRAKVYPPEAVTPTAPVSRLTYCERNVAPEAMPKLGYEYSYRFLPVVYDRIYLGGVRLARLLEEAL